MAMIRFFIDEWRKLWHDGHDRPERPDAARLRHKLWRKEVGVAVIVLGATAMFIEIARGLAGIAG
ncbi:MULTISPECIES: hypothetical protein [unclassified Cupriavidus]|uniref:hypothetical protein n=1 Tax=unclassified Cupriavidus TaxID=2640874 RepID=UPI001AE5293D|nr:MULTISPECIES: hypothetical protein [unclassified Cupriavidus]MBP0627899.1 hypothetical protein [Cupriavidus sp. AcVe19-1a]MBP0633788.1 hypothetical protein [Cupriavidus sp. AcVe19-6a]